MTPENRISLRYTGARSCSAASICASRSARGWSWARWARRPVAVSPLLVGFGLGVAQLPGSQATYQTPSRGQQDQEAGADAGPLAPDQPAPRPACWGSRSIGAGPGCCVHGVPQRHLGHRPHGQADRQRRWSAPARPGPRRRRPSRPTRTPARVRPRSTGTPVTAWSRSTSGPRQRATARHDHAAQRGQRPAGPVEVERASDLLHEHLQALGDQVAGLEVDLAAGRGGQLGPLGGVAVDLQGLLQGRGDVLAAHQLDAHEAQHPVVVDDQCW